MSNTIADRDEGAFTSSKVFRGKWNHTDVALKVMRNTEDITPRVTVRLSFS